MSSSSSAAPTSVRALPLADLRSATAPHALAETLLGSLASSAREQGHQEGYAAGWAQARAEAQVEAVAFESAARARHEAAETRRAREHAAAVAALETAATQVRGQLEQLAATVEEQATDLAYALVDTLMAHEVADATGADVVRRVLQVLPGVSERATATVRLHPSVVAASTAQELAALGIVVVSDPALDRADALVESDGSVVDLRISAAMQRVREVLA